MKTKRVVEVVIIGVVVLCAGLVLHRPASAETEIEKVERQIAQLELELVRCPAEIDSIEPPGLNDTEEEKALFERLMKLVEECVAKLERDLNTLRKRLAELKDKLPSAELPREDPETRKLREKLADWQKRVAEGERRKNELKARVEQLKKEKKH